MISRPSNLVQKLPLQRSGPKKGFFLKIHTNKIQDIQFAKEDKNREALWCARLPYNIGLR